jgi:import inner membrane translocase subunit TIM10
MSWLLGGGRRQPTTAEKIAMMEAEMEMSITMFDRYGFDPFARDSLGIISLTHFSLRMIQSCINKCVPTSYHEGELNKGESVCIDRCVSKFFSTAQKIQEKANETPGQSSGAGGMFGM